ncbi:hypothetical protein TNCV_2905031 [Trichonephila clavipes]|nr:hypothetical protein TNCV_2905031 [Trichonephila clavipes]
MRTKAYCAHSSICGLEVHVQMFRSGGQSDVKPPMVSSQASLVLIYQPLSRLSRPCPAWGLNLGPVV